MVPVRNLLREPILHRRDGLLNQLEPGCADLRKMFGDDVG